MTAVRVMIVDDHEIVREGTRSVLENDGSIAVVGEATTAQEALVRGREARPDIVLLDLALPDGNAIAIIPRLLQAVPACKVLVLSAYDEDDYVVAAMEAGAAGYLLKTARSKQVVEALHLVSEGQVVLDPSVAVKLRRSRGRAQAMPLSDRETEVLRLAARGLRNKEIARSMYISVRTVEGHFSHILTKLGVSSRTEAVIYGVAHRWVDVD